MKKTLLALFGLAISTNVSAQLLDGTYVYLSGGLETYIEICDSGNVVCNLTIKDREKDNVIYQGSGSWKPGANGGCYIVNGSTNKLKYEPTRNSFIVKHPKNKEHFNVILSDVALTKL
jgi:hypothetical protein